jgi:tetratricopeptide (TPR) repeat protein
MSATWVFFGSKLTIASLIALSATTTNATTLSQRCHALNQRAIGFIDGDRAGEAAAFLSETIRQFGESSDDKFCKALLLINLAIATFRLGNLNAAEHTANEGLALMEQTLGTRAPELRQPLQALASFALHHDKLKRADELISRIESLPWETHVDLAAEHGLRATLLAQAENETEAEREYRAAISEWELVGTRDLPLDAVPDLWNLATLYLNMRRGNDALLLLKRGLDISETSPLNLELRVRILFGLGVAYTTVRDPESAERSFQKAIQLLDSVTPVFRSSLGQVLYEAYSVSLKSRGRKQEAKELKRRGESLYGRDTSGMTVGIESLLPREKGR